MSAPVFLAPPGSLDDVAPGGTYTLEGAEARHAGVVQRRAAGERVDVVDCAGVRLECTVAAVGGEGVRLDVVDVVREPAPDVSLVLVQALAKGDRDELAIEAATEVGVDAVLPWQAERSVVVWRGDRAAKSRARWLGTVRAAAKQSRRARVPDVGLAVDGRALAARVAATVAAGGVALVLHEEASAPLADTPLPTAGKPGAPAPEVLVVVGPEGGISPAELGALRDAGAVAVRLGPHVLRTSTAGPVALAMLAQRLGRWG
ncbi:16S rRNA (uracil(1498)-N(3))-methyltransferase [Cellulomonas chengniuliangii]|uniref:16S rRNA (uracil(1498)-N(3))-methyltransferase n=1 Tax=Cellulomonas chengniuliangii TaxID=2968084 RepID=UPI001D0E35CE|nr:16S rRNA (uracil(1498)-N(3))-methyltransferase [Cellulomonas chengniuliangii]MCC2318251.1 16S rRNA (uracil(1498)-N(3))-methyltransferase [Cellulomonas chengniuliangii]